MACSIEALCHKARGVSTSDKVSAPVDTMFQEFLVVGTNASNSKELTIWDTSDAMSGVGRVKVEVIRAVRRFGVQICRDFPFII